MATTCQPLTYRRLQTQLQPNEELSHPSWGNHTCHDAQEAEIPRHALKQVTLTPGAAQCHQTWTWRLALMLCPTWMWPQYTLIRLGRSLPGPFSLWRGGRFSGQPPSFEQRQPWVFLSCGSQHIQCLCDQFNGWESKRISKKGCISSWKPWEWKKDAHHFQYPYIHIYSHNNMLFLCSVLCCSMLSSSWKQQFQWQGALYPQAGCQLLCAELPMYS